MFSSISSIIFSFSSSFFYFVRTCDPNKWCVGGNGGGGGKLKLLVGGCGSWGGGTYRSAPRNGDERGGGGGGGWKNEGAGGGGGGDKLFLLLLSFNLFSLFCMIKSSPGDPGAFINLLPVSFLTTSSSLSEDLSNNRVFRIKCAYIFKH